MVEQDKAIPQRGRMNVLQHVVLNRHGDRQAAGGHRLVGRPGQRVGRPTGHPVDLPILEAGHQARPLDGIRRAVAQLALVIVAPGEHLPVVGAGHTVQRPGGNGDDLAALQSGHLARSPHVVVRAVAEAMVVALAPGEHGARAGEADGELGAALHLHRTQPRQTVHL